MNSLQSFRELVVRMISADFSPEGVQPVFPFQMKKEKSFSEEDILQELAVTFLILLGGKDHPQYESAVEKLDAVEKQGEWQQLIRFLSRALREVPREILLHSKQNPAFEDNIRQAGESLAGENGNQVIDALHAVFFPEGRFLDEEEKRSRKIDDLRRKRMVSIEKLNPRPITRPDREIIFTSNVLLTVPLNVDQQNQHLDETFKSVLREVCKERQKFWYDHPIPLGIEPKNNEILHGLYGLEEMLNFEIEKGHIPAESRLTVILSASTTHDGLHPLVEKYFTSLLHEAEALTHIDLYIFNEDDTGKLLDGALIPLVERYFPGCGTKELSAVFGVDGEYGRHYSFLKAISALWQVFVDSQVKATFKIDLDQVFPQKELCAQSGSSALRHLCTPLWGATGRDEQHREVELGMIAGALVNHDDIHKSLFSPDIVFPAGKKLSADELIFHSSLPQAQSTQAEMMTRYLEKDLDDKEKVLQRIHVTGGANGILIEALRKHRPFTPSIIGRAEDQAYLLSVLFAQKPALRYLHKPGLIMRHDKQVFAGEAISAAATGKRIGDYIRILLFSFYGKALPWPMDDIKKVIDPFTGCFMSPIPVTVVYLRFLFEILVKIQGGQKKQAVEFARSGAQRLNKLMDWLLDGANPLKDVYYREKSGWDLYYDVLDVAEEKLGKKDGFTLEMREKIKRIVQDCFIKTDYIGSPKTGNRAPVEKNSR